MEWDPQKAEANERKHGIRFADVDQVFLDPYAITIEDDSSKLEQRFVTIGIDGLNQILVVVYTYRGDQLRLISARLATSNEVKSYEEGI